VLQRIGEQLVAAAGLSGFFAATWVFFDRNDANMLQLSAAVEKIQAQS
jgi:hypothetical protein